MNVLEDIVKSGLFERLAWAVVVCLLSIIVYVLISKFLKAKEKRNSKIFSQKKNKTYLRMLRNIVGAVLGVITVLTVLQIFGVNVSSMLAGVGIASIVVGFALQDAMKDIIRGLEIISDGYYDIGDIIKYQDVTGEVLAIGLRTTRVQDINSMNMVSIANRNIDQVEVVSEYIYISVPLAHEVKLPVAEAAFDEIVKAIRKLKPVTAAEYQGVTDVTTTACEYQIMVTCDPANKLAVRRSALRLIVAGLTAHKISVGCTEIRMLNK